MASVIPFTFEDSDIRVLDQDGEPWFVARDIALALGYSDTACAVRDHCRKAQPVGGGGVSPTLDPQTKIIPESDVYRLVMRSKLHTAERFQDWICETVIPSIRKTGKYQTEPTPQLTPLIALRQALDGWEAAEAKLAISERNVGRLANQVEEMKPCAAALELITSSPKSVIPRAAAKALGFSPIAFIKWLKDNKWAYDSSSGVLPMQDKVNSGCLELKYYDKNFSEYFLKDSPGRRPQLLITGKGMEKLSKLITLGEVDEKSYARTS